MQIHHQLKIFGGIWVVMHAVLNSSMFWGIRLRNRCIKFIAECVDEVISSELTAQDRILFSSEYGAAQKKRFR